MEERIKRYGLSLGLDVVAIGPAAPYLRAWRTLQERARRGLYPPFTERDVDRRCYPDRLLPGARSVIAAGISYLTEDRPRGSVAGRPRGTVSRYAWGQDYHRVLAERLQALAAYTQSLLAERGEAVEFQIHVDTGPPLDREVAAEAGLGWFGKNAMLYAPGVGSWIFLGEIFLTAELTPDPRVSLDCGECTRCIDACPTGAITAPYEVDPYRCISYLTQAPGMVPEPLREKMGTRVWGCDVCQQVCPWNAEAAVPNRPEFRPLPGAGPEPDLISWLRMSKKEFQRTIGPTAMAWRGKKTLQRNAAIALGNSRNPRAVPALREALLNDPKPVVRQASAWALGRIGGPEARAALEEAWKREREPEVKEEIRKALDKLAAPAPPAAAVSSPAGRRDPHYPRP